MQADSWELDLTHKTIVSDTFLLAVQCRTHVNHAEILTVENLGLVGSRVPGSCTIETRSVATIIRV